MPHKGQIKRHARSILVSRLFVIAVMVLLQLGVLLLELGDLHLIARDRVFNHSLRIQTAGQAGDHVPVAVNAAVAVAQLGD